MFVIASVAKQSRHIREIATQPQAARDDGCKQSPRSVMAGSGLVVSKSDDIRNQPTVAGAALELNVLLRGVAPASRLLPC